MFAHLSLVTVVSSLPIFNNHGAKQLKPREYCYEKAWLIGCFLKINQSQEKNT